MTHMMPTIVVSLILGTGIAAMGIPSTGQQATAPSEYSQCLSDPNTAFQVGVYQLEHPRLKSQEIAHILCRHK